MLILGSLKLERKEVVDGDCRLRYDVRCIVVDYNAKNLTAFRHAVFFTHRIFHMQTNLSTRIALNHFLELSGKLKVEFRKHASRFFQRVVSNTLDIFSFLSPFHGLLVRTTRCDNQVLIQFILPAREETWLRERRYCEFFNFITFSPPASTPRGT